MMLFRDLRQEFGLHLHQREEAYHRAIETPLHRASTLHASSKYQLNYSAALGGNAGPYLTKTAIARPKLLPSDVCSSTRVTPRFYADPPSSFSLVRALQAGAGKWAQVWLASAVRGPPTGSLEPVVIKLFQESFFPIPDLADFAAGFLGHADEFAHKEAWAFNALKELQGTLLPYSLGFFLFTLPCGETVCGHVMEVVDGRTLQRDFSNILDSTFEHPERVKQRQLLIEKMTLSVHLAHSLGVVHGDLRPENILISPPPDCFVILDWTHSKPAYVPHSIVDQDWPGLRDCLEEIGSAEMVAAWVSQQVQEGVPWIEMLDDSMNEISQTVKFIRKTAPKRERLILMRGEYLREEGMLDEEVDESSDVVSTFPHGAFVPDTLGTDWD